MTEDKAKAAMTLLYKIRSLKDDIRILKDERAAGLTGLDPNAPGPKHHVLTTLSNEWDRLGEKCVAFFIAAMDEAIANEEENLAEFTKKLEEL